MAFYSHSRLETFNACRLKYKFRYVDKVEAPIQQSVEAFVGSRVHDALEKLYRDLMVTKTNSLSEILAFYGDHWKKEWGSDILVANQSRTADDYFAYGEKCIRNYFERFKPFDQSRTLGLEMRMNFAFDSEGRYKVTGLIDRVARRADGTYEIHDYKTSAYLPAQKDADSDRQLALYQIGLQDRWRDVERVELIWHYVGFSTDLISRRTPDELVEVRQETIRQIQAVEGERVFAPSVGEWCARCEYRPVCPAWKHVDAVGALPHEQLSTDEGVRLVNEFSEVSNQMAELQRQKEDLRERIFAFAEQMGTALIQGSGVRASISTREQTNFPGKREALRKELVTFLKQSGRWDEVSDFDATQLSEILDNESWPPELLEELRKFAHTEVSTTLRLSRTQGKTPEER